LTERRPGFRIEMVPTVIGCMGGGMEKLKGQIRKVLNDDKNVTAVSQEMLWCYMKMRQLVIRKGLIEGE